MWAPLSQQTKHILRTLNNVNGRKRIRGHGDCLVDRVNHDTCLDRWCLIMWSAIIVDTMSQPTRQGTKKSHEDPFIW